MYQNRYRPGLGQASTLALKPGVAPDAPVESVGVIEGGQLVWKQMRVAPYGPRESDPPGTIRDGLYRLCPGPTTIYGPGTPGRLIYGAPWDFFLVDNQSCPIPVGLPPCVKETTTRERTIAFQWNQGVRAMCQPTNPKPASGWSTAPTVALPIDVKALAGEAGRREKLQEFIRLVQMREAGYEIGFAPLEQLIDGFRKHFRENPEALALFWQRYRQAVRYDRTSMRIRENLTRGVEAYYRVMAPAGLALIGIFAAVGLIYAVGFAAIAAAPYIFGAGSGAAIASVPGGIATAAAMPYFAAGVSTISAGFSLTTQVGTAIAKKQIADDIKQQMREQAAKEQALEVVMEHETQAMLKRLADKTDEQILTLIPVEIRKLATTMAANGANPEQTRAMMAVAADVETYIGKNHKAPSNEWIVDAVNRAMQPIVAADQQALVAIDTVTTNAQADFNEEAKRAAMTAAPGLPAGNRTAAVGLPANGFPLAQAPPRPAAAPDRIGLILAVAAFFLLR